MTVARALGSESAGAAALRWGACLLLVLGLHAGAAWVLLRRAPHPELPVLAPDAVMLDLAPEPAAVHEALPQPATPPLPEPKPDPEPPPVEAPPEPVPSAPSLPQPAAVLPEPPPPPAPKRPVPPRPARPPPPRPAQASPSQPTPEVPAPAPPPTTSAAPSLSAFPEWRSALFSRVQRAKRYPDTARAREEQGAAAVAFTMDRSGHVLSAKLVRSSGSSSLDEEAVAMVRRADPLPPMPSELPGSTLTLTIPVTFSLR